MNHSLYVMTGKQIADFMVSAEDQLQPGGVNSVAQAVVPPVKERNILVLVTRVRMASCHMVLGFRPMACVQESSQTVLRHTLSLGE